VLPSNHCEALFSPSAQVLWSQRPPHNLLRHCRDCCIFFMNGLMGLPNVDGRCTSKCILSGTSVQHSFLYYYIKVIANKYKTCMLLYPVL
jgi:hypothetical protein